ncbi:uncharacterized protein MELLADRAFT_73759 [Melampsora larici-populina 98AG31]|uniref:Uncharacterized protein n=1 Tax=Melampsora larici-populina (strain 98AG31 / pathotype 3-4-7) TaxID=747676 RepID=F4SEC8_MELLP|nr:uncharacterized protein MELLADRAFT_73759 [Melampsora larici-populina 98AG31]EGF96998.1 hypothetical protein MELLADRAFT_73759 [Melampsora larici-populina 98AG31]
MVANLLISVRKPLDDRKLHLEEVVVFPSRAGKNRHNTLNKYVDAAQNQFITLLWDQQDLSHPPTVDLNPNHCFRKVDGSDTTSPMIHLELPINRIPDLFDLIILSRLT